MHQDVPGPKVECRDGVARFQVPFGPSHLCKDEAAARKLISDTWAEFLRLQAPDA